MNVKAVLAGRDVPVRLVIFDCDGVLIDSEAVASRVVAEQLVVVGWAMDAGEAQARFMGMTIGDMVPVIEARLGHELPAYWRPGLTRAVVAAMGREAVLVEGAVGALDACDRLGVPWRVASNSSHEELAAKFARVGLGARVKGRVHSHRDVGVGKPAPDLFLAAAAAGGEAPGACLVIEDSVPGVTAARRAGMMCLGYAPHGGGAALAALGALVFHSMDEVPGLLEALVWHSNEVVL